MSRISFFLFPEFKEKISVDGLRKSLDLVESIVGYSKGKSLRREAIDRIRERLGSRMRGTRLYPGGSSVLFCWSFSFEVGSIVIKPYYSRELSALVIHYLTCQDFLHDFQNLHFQFKDKEIRITLPQVIGLAKIETFSRVYPVLIATEAIGKSIQAHPPLIKIISSVARDLGQKGIICDPYPSNWNISFVNGQGNIQYIDLLSSNRLKNVNSRIAELLQDLK